MALAILHYEDSNITHCRFRIDIGTTNRFYTYAIGDHRMLQRHGLVVFAQPKVVSPLLSLEAYRLGRGVLTIPHPQFDTRHCYVQLISYRTADKQGPALSAITRVPLFSSSQ